jgi:hypothetical protein
MKVPHPELRPTRPRARVLSLGWPQLEWAYAVGRMPELLGPRATVLSVSQSVVAARRWRPGAICHGPVTERARCAEIGHPASGRGGREFEYGEGPAGASATGPVRAGGVRIPPPPPALPQPGPELRNRSSRRPQPPSVSRWLPRLVPARWPPSAGALAGPRLSSSFPTVSAEPTDAGGACTSRTWLSRAGQPQGSTTEDDCCIPQHRGAR